MAKIADQLKQVKLDYQAAEPISNEERNLVLLELAKELEQATSLIVSENQKDLAKMAATDPKYDRLKLTPERILGIANDLRRVATIPSPINRILLERTLPNGLHLKKITVPLGLIGVIYEARPNVTIDVFSLCFKAGSACVLKGGSEAIASNTVLVNLIYKVLERHNISNSFAYLMPANREYVHDLLQAVGVVDICIPRGSAALIKFVRENAKIPVIETGAGIVHTYFDKSGNVTIAADIINNAKTRRVSVCNALDTLLIHKERLADLPQLVQKLANNNVELFADAESYAQLVNSYPNKLLFKANPDSYGQEFLDYKMSIKTVASAHEAISHIMHYTSGHSEAIIAEDQYTINTFMQKIDAAAVYVNASTAFTDGGEFGMGAEIGISTQKLHARGPMGLEELVSYKWLIYGNGQIR